MQNGWVAFEIKFGMADSMEFICTGLDAEECRADMEQKKGAEQKRETEDLRIFR